MTTFLTQDRLFLLFFDKSIPKTNKPNMMIRLLTMMFMFPLKKEFDTINDNDNAIRTNSGLINFASLSIIFFSIVVHILDRKSTRLNSSHVRISYAVFCLKKKKFL